MKASYRNVSSGRRAGIISLAVAGLGLAPTVAFGQVDQFEFFFNSSVSQGGTNAMGGFTYDPANNVFYTVGFTGTSQAIRKITNSGGVWSGAVNVGQTDWVNKFMASTSVAGNGTILPATFSSTNTPGDVLLNPANITIDGVTYAPGTLGVIVDQALVRDTSNGNAVQPQYVKSVYVYDLRAIDSTPGSNTGRDRNGNTAVDWNDVFTPIATMQDLQTVQAAVNGSPVTSTTLNIARRFAFSTDGQSIYFNDAASTFGGIWKVNLTNPGAAGITKVVQAIGGSRINSEPAVLHTSVRDFGAGGSGDQVLFQGATDIGNLGGISYILDNNTSLQTPHTLLTNKQLTWFFDNPTQAGGDVGSITSDAAGNVYFMQTTNNAGVFMYDTAGRLVKVFSNAEQRVFDASQGATTFNNNALDIKVRDKTVAFPSGSATLPQVLYNDASGIRTVIGAIVYKPGDFNRDNVVDAADVALFKAQLGLRGAVVASVATSTPFTQVNTANLKYDLNGSFTSGGAASVAIDWRDVKIFQQFAGLSDGDVDMDFDVDATDLATLAANYGGTGKLFTQGNLTSVRIAAADKDDVNFADLVTLAANWTAAKPVGPVGSIPSADLDRAFAITSGGAISQYSAGGSGNWGDAANWTAGVPDAAGAVASLLTKPQDDTTITLGGTVTVGQINFDNYFIYTLSGGTLRLASNNGTSAEVNAFAASPTIASALDVQTDATVTVTYAADTVTISGPLTIAAGQTLSKAGAGALKISGGGSSAGTLATGPGTTEVAASLTVGNLAGSGALSVTGSGTKLAIAPHAVPGAATVAQLGSLLLAADASLDLANNKLVVATGGNGAANAALVAALASGYDGGLWTGAGVNSSTAAADADHISALGYVADASTFTVVSTYFGDANLDGVVDSDDFALLDRGLAMGLIGWVNGDFNYSGGIEAGDFLAIDRTYLHFHPAAAPGLLAEREAQFGDAYVSSLLASVPEPASLAGCGVAVASLIGRRRRQNER